MTPIVPKSWLVPAEWTKEAAKPFQAFVQAVNQALSGNLLIKGNTYGDIVTVAFTVGASLAAIPLPVSRVTTPPVGLLAMKLIDTKVPETRLQVPSLTWHYDGKRAVIDALDPTTVAQLVNGHAYELTVWVVGG